MNRILLADDHEVMRTGLKLFISNLIAFPVIDEAWDGNSVIDKVKQNDYQLIILDVNMPATDSFHLIRYITSIKPDAKILMCSMNPEDLYAIRYLQLGAKGYIAKTATTSELGNAILTVFNNNRYLSDKLKEQLSELTGGNNKNFNPFAKLSARESEIVMLMLKGESSASISQMLHIQSSTMATFKARIFQKLNCKNVLDITRLAQIYNFTPTV